MEKAKEFTHLFLGLSPKTQDYLINMCQLALIEKKEVEKLSNSEKKVGTYEHQR